MRGGLRLSGACGSGCLGHEMTNLSEAKKVRLLYSLKDFQVALSAYDFLSEVDFDALISKVELRRLKCYETTMIVSYVRPFSAAYGKVKPLKFEDIGIVLSEKEAILHDRLISLRNKVFAHSDGDRMRLVAKPMKIEMSDGFTFQTFQTAFDDGLEFSDYMEIMDVSGLIRRMFHAVWTTLHDTFGQDPDWTELRQDYLAQHSAEDG